MFSLDIRQEELGGLITKMDSNDFSRFLYCQRMVSTFLAIHKLEHMIIAAMTMCDRIRVRKVLNDDLEKWDQMIAKSQHLQRSTLGSLISILEQNAIDAADIAYLRWVKDKRDYFIHRLFHSEAWPGDLNAEACHHMSRRLRAIEIWLLRAERRIWYIFERAGLVEIDDLGENGLLVMNADVYDLLSAESSLGNGGQATR